MGTTINIFWAPLVLCFDVHLMHGNNSEKHLEDFQWGSQTRKESYSISPNLWVSLQLIHCRDCSSLGNHFKCYNIYHFLTNIYYKVLIQSYSCILGLFFFVSFFWSFTVKFNFLVLHFHCDRIITISVFAPLTETLFALSHCVTLDI